VNSPSAPGATQTLDLKLQLHRYVAVRAIDEQGNAGRAALVDRRPPDGGGGGGSNGGGGNNNGGGGNNNGGGCTDRLAPRTTIARKKLRASRKRGFKVSGASRDRGCAGLRRVDLVIAKLSGPKCRFVRSGGGLTHRRRCARLVLIHARGARSWGLSLKHKMPSGRYRITASGLDKKGNRELRRSANTVTVRIR
jgi:hypothetical protein